MPPKRPKEEEPEMKVPQSLNFNSLIGIIAVGAIFWVGNKTTDNSSSLTKLETQLPYVTSAMSELKSQIAQMVTRSELDSFRTEVNARMSTWEKRVSDFEKKKETP